MSCGLPSRVLGSSSRGSQNGSSVQFRVCTSRSAGRQYCHVHHQRAFEWRWPNLQISFQIRDGGLQFKNSCQGVDEPRASDQRAAVIYGEMFPGVSSWCVRPSRRPCNVISALDGNMPSITERRLSGQLPAEEASSAHCFSAVRECSDTADCRVSEAGPSNLAVQCDAGSSDNRKEEILWTNESVTTASSALAEWRSARTRSGQDIVDWGRYHLQVMFVDRSHRARSRLAEGLFERIAAWNGFGLILYGHSCGINAKEGELPTMSYQGEAQRLGVARHVFKAPATTLDRSDLDSYDLIVAMDIEVRDEVLRMAGSQSPNGNDYTNKVRLISEFVSYGTGTTSLLEDSLLEIIQPDLPQARKAHEVQATYMSQYSKWRMMVATITMCCAGLIQFLMDAYPDDLPDYDPVD